MPELIQDVSDTAFWVAYFRAEETSRADALFQDPLAARLSGERGKKIAFGMARAKYTRWSVVLRTVVIDQLIVERVAAGVDTVVNLGAGLDTRPYRMDLPPSLRWVEIDQPGIVEFKERELAGEKPKVELQRLKLDLSQPGALKKLLSEIAAKSEQVLVLSEGVIPYLTPEQVGTLADELRSEPHVRTWITEYYAPEVLRFLKKARGMKRQMKNAPFQFFPQSEWMAFFAEHGWKPSEIRYLGEAAQKHGRPMPMPWLAELLRRLIPAKKRAEMARMMGYAVFER